MAFTNFTKLEKVLGSSTLCLVLSITVFVTKYINHMDDYISYQDQMRNDLQTLREEQKSLLNKLHTVELELKGVTVTVGHISSSTPSTTYLRVPTSPSSEIYFKDLKITTSKENK